MAEIISLTKEREISAGKIELISGREILTFPDNHYLNFVLYNPHHKKGIAGSIEDIGGVAYSKYAISQDIIRKDNGTFSHSTLNDLEQSLRYMRNNGLSENALHHFFGLRLYVPVMGDEKDMSEFKQKEQDFFKAYLNLLGLPEGNVRLNIGGVEDKSEGREVFKIIIPSMRMLSNYKKITFPDWVIDLK